MRTLAQWTIVHCLGLIGVFSSIPLELSPRYHERYKGDTTFYFRPKIVQKLTHYWMLKDNKRWSSSKWKVVCGRRSQTAFTWIEMAFTEQGFRGKLAELNSTQQSIQTLSLWLIHHRKHAETYVAIWNAELRKGEQLFFFSTSFTHICDSVYSMIMCGSGC